jgi:hypothetical protein
MSNSGSISRSSSTRSLNSVAPETKGPDTPAEQSRVEPAVHQHQVEPDLHALNLPGQEHSQSLSDSEQHAPDSTSRPDAPVLLRLPAVVNWQTVANPPTGSATGRFKLPPPGLLERQNRNRALVRAAGDETAVPATARYRSASDADERGSLRAESKSSNSVSPAERALSPSRSSGSDRETRMHVPDAPVSPSSGVSSSGDIRKKSASSSTGGKFSAFLTRTLGRSASASVATTTTKPAVPQAVKPPETKSSSAEATLMLKDPNAGTEKSQFRNEAMAMAANGSPRGDVLGYVMADHDRRSDLKAYMVPRRTQENIEFLEAREELEKLAPASGEAIAKATAIYDKYIAPVRAGESSTSTTNKNSAATKLNLQAEELGPAREEWGKVLSSRIPDVAAFAKSLDAVREKTHQATLFAIDGYMRPDQKGFTGSSAALYQNPIGTPDKAASHLGLASPAEMDHLTSVLPPELHHDLGFVVACRTLDRELPVGKYTQFGLIFSRHLGEDAPAKVAISNGTALEKEFMALKKEPPHLRKIAGGSELAKQVKLADDELSANIKGFIHTYNAGHPEKQIGMVAAETKVD